MLSIRLATAPSILRTIAASSTCWAAIGIVTAQPKTAQPTKANRR